MKSRSSVRHRHTAVRRVQKMYRKDDAGLNGRCVYCGNGADTSDHIPPVSLAAELDLSYLKDLDPVLVPACRNCNSIIGASPEIKLVDRRDIVANHLSQKKSRMLKLGREIYEKNIPIINDFRDAACLNIFQRYMFATLSTAEVSEPIEPEETYSREDFSKIMDTPDLSPIAWLISWGIRERNCERIGIQIMNSDKIDESFLDDREIVLYRLAKKLEPLRGPFNWLRSWQKYANLIEKSYPKTFGNLVVSEGFKDVETSWEALAQLSELFYEAEIISKELFLSLGRLISSAGIKAKIIRKPIDHKSKKIELEGQNLNLIRTIKSLRTPTDHQGKKIELESQFDSQDLNLIRTIKSQASVSQKELQKINIAAFKFIYSFDDQWPLFSLFKEFPKETDLFFDEMMASVQEIRNLEDLKELIADMPPYIPESIFPKLSIEKIWMLLLMSESLPRKAKERFLEFIKIQL